MSAFKTLKSQNLKAFMSFIDLLSQILNKENEIQGDLNRKSDEED